MSNEGGNKGTHPGTGESFLTADWETEKAGENERTGGHPYRLLLPPDVGVWHEARRIAADPQSRVEDLATCASQDPVIVLELLKTANAMFFAGGRQTITSAKAAIVRLGSEVVIETLTHIAERPALEHDEISHWLEVHRARCRRTSLVARMISESIAKNLSDDCQTAGLLLFVGEMLAVSHFGETYVALAEQLARSGIIYRLAQDHKYDVERIGLNYLRRQGIPEALLFAIDRESSSKSRDRAIMKPLCFAAGELVEAFDLNRWEKLAPGKTLAPKSSLRVLQLNDQQYLKLYERAGEFLFNYRLMQEKKKQAGAPVVEGTRPSSDATDSIKAEAGSLNDEINSILGNLDAPPPPSDAPKAPAKAVAPAAKTTINVVQQVLSDPTDSFSLQTSAQKPKMVRQTVPSPAPKEPPKLVSPKGAEVVTNIAQMFGSATSSEQLLSDLLAMLVDNGPFEKSALIVVSRDKAQAIVVAARGPNIGNGQKISITDPLNPLAQCFSKVQSFGNRESEYSPFGSKSFALAPINADHDTPVALYADCGNDKSITFEARRVFRTVVEILNERLPQIPGGIPVELRQ